MSWVSYFPFVSDLQFDTCCWINYLMLSNLFKQEMIMSLFIIEFIVLSFWRFVWFINESIFIRQKLVLFIMKNQLFIDWSNSKFLFYFGLWPNSKFVVFILFTSCWYNWFSNFTPFHFFLQWAWFAHSWNRWI